MNGAWRNRQLDWRHVRLLEEARYQFEVNVFGLARLAQLLLPGMRAKGSGRIINITSSDFARDRARDLARETGEKN